MLVSLAFIAFWPSPVDQSVQGQLFTVLQFLYLNGIPRWFNYEFVEASANVALFIPLGAITALAFTKKRLWWIGAFGLIISGSMELGQLLFLHQRFANSLDLVTNAFGTILGALLAFALQKKVQVRNLPAADL